MARSPGSTSGLTPWIKGDGRAAEAGRRSAIARAAKRDAERGDVTSMVGRLRTLAAASEGVDLTATCIGVAVYVLGLVTAGTVPIRHGSDAAELVRVLVDVARLASGQPTSTSAIVHMSAADARARLAELAELAAGKLADVAPVVDAVSAAATAVDDPQVVETGQAAEAGTDPPGSDGGGAEPA